MWNPIARFTGALSPPRAPTGGPVRGVGPERMGRFDVPYNPYVRRRFVELCVVFVVIGLVLYLLIPTIAGTTESARRATCAGHLRRLAQAVEMYQMDYEAYPPTETWVFALFDLLTTPRENAQEAASGDGDLGPSRSRLAEKFAKEGAEALFCPSEESLPRPLRKNNWVNSSYSYRNPGAVVQDESGTAIFWDYLGGTGGGAHPGGGQVVFLDGHVIWKPHTEWQHSDQP
jgi:prepilin-type processing-associated H-X9-DG protein